MQLTSMVAGALLLVASDPGEADYFNGGRSGATYFNRVGATLAEQNADMTACGVYLLGPPAPDAPVNSSFLSRLIWSGPVERYIASINAGRMETCMVARGWRVVSLPEVEQARLNDLNDDALRAELDGMVGAESPVGELVREWGNEGSRPSSVRWSGEPPVPVRADVTTRIFTLVAAQGEPPAAVQPQRHVQYELIRKDGRFKPPAAGKAVIIFRVQGGTFSYGTNLGFVQRDDGEGQTAKRYLAQGWTAPLFIGREGNWYSFTVPPGRWILGESGSFNFCLGGPSFEAPEGAVVYAGTFNITGERLGPVLDLEPVRERLGGDVGGRLVAANYDRNGDEFPCPLFFGPPYALEIEGLPAVEGSRARPAPRP
ncbi:hypothetical protein [Brevundimonas sp. FT23028]|uniref:hypothetical protein n=1 Tax=Brevundimonas sp. FT23028 TaxID=3393748 RepID=UPI003B588239